MRRRLCLGAIELYCKNRPWDNLLSSLWLELEVRWPTAWIWRKCSWLFAETRQFGLRLSQCPSPIGRMSVCYWDTCRRGTSRCEWQSTHSLGLLVPRPTHMLTAKHSQPIQLPRSLGKRNEWANCSRAERRSESWSRSESLQSRPLDSLHTWVVIEPEPATQYRSQGPQHCRMRCLRWATLE